MIGFVGRCRTLHITHSRAVDVVAAAVFLVFIRLCGSGPLTLETVLLSVTLAVCMVARRRAPIAATAVATAGVVVGIADGGVHAPYPVALLLTVYQVAVSTDRRTSVICGIAVEAVLLTGILVWSPETWWQPANLVVLLWTALAIAAGEAVRHRRAFIAAAEERLRRIEQSREEEVRHRIVEERLRIARELHDVVAHHIALINVQASVAAHVLHDQPALAETALRHVTVAGSTVLGELGSLLAVLREPGDPEAPLEPSPSLTQLDDLIDRFAATGVLVERVTTGALRTLPTTVQLTAYRLVQESLTNVHKHASGASTRLHFDFAERSLRITVRNGPGREQRSAAPSVAAGHGLLGMRERVSSIGGSLTAAPTSDGGFSVTADLPTPRATA